MPFVDFKKDGKSPGTEDKVYPGGCNFALLTWSHALPVMYFTAC